MDVWASHAWFPFLADTHTRVHRRGRIGPANQLLHESIAPVVLERLIKAYQQVKIGDPLTRTLARADRPDTIVERACLADGPGGGVRRSERAHQKNGHSGHPVRPTAHAPRRGTVPTRRRPGPQAGTTPTRRVGVPHRGARGRA